MAYDIGHIRFGSFERPPPKKLPRVTNWKFADAVDFQSPNRKLVGLSATNLDERPVTRL